MKPTKSDPIIVYTRARALADDSRNLWASANPEALKDENELFELAPVVFLGSQGSAMESMYSSRDPTIYYDDHGDAIRSLVDERAAKPPKLP